jgi:DNA-binding Lrp family transcriptional regulator
VKLKRKNFVELKKVDSILLEEKTFNPKERLSDIAAKYHLHRNTVSNRWKKLLNSGMILKETLDLTQKGYDEIGLELKAFISIKPTPGHEGRVVKMLLKEPKIQDLFSTLSNELVAIIRTENSQTLLEFHKMLFKMPNSIKHTDTIIFLSKHSRAGWTMNEIQTLIPKL